MNNTASELYNQLLGTYFDEYYYLWDAERKKWIANIAISPMKSLKKVITT